MYRYKATVTDVYDADTITVDVDLGFHAVLRKIKVRLYGINAPEMRGPQKPQGTISRDWLRDQILDREIILQTYRSGRGKGKYGRWLGEIFLTSSAPQSLNAIMVDQGLALKADY